MITIAHLYPKQMNVYGDMGNIITLQYRLEARGFDVRYKAIDSLSEFKPSDVDILIGGGGQDSNQGLIQSDLLKHKEKLIAACNEGVPMLMICGMYQMFGKKFVLPNGAEIAGIGLLDIETRAGEDRLTGNIVVNTPFGKLVGFENHSGRTYLGDDVEPLGKVIKGAGNNGTDETEGVIYKNVFGSYMHGPGLAKNPAFADEIIRRALVRRGQSGELEPLEDFYELKAASTAMKRPR